MTTTKKYDPSAYPPPPDRLTSPYCRCGLAIIRDRRYLGKWLCRRCGRIQEHAFQIYRALAQRAPE